jgi:integrase
MAAAGIVSVVRFLATGVDAMAGLGRGSGGSWQVSWRDAEGRKRAVRLGRMTRRSAESMQRRIEQLVDLRRVNERPPADLLEWSRGLDPDLLARLVHAGLLEQTARLTLGAFLEQYLASRTGVAEATAVRDRQVVRLLLERFGADRPLDAIGPREAEQWRSWLARAGNKRDLDRAGLGDNTVRRRTGLARQIFAVAIRWKLLTDNPFAGLAASVGVNPDRQAFVPWSDVLLVIEQAPTAEWRALLAFARLTGCRVPSELAGLTWADVDLAGRRVMIRSPKTAHHGADHARRWCPLFPELLPFLEDLAAMVGPGVECPLSAPVFPMASDPRVNLRTQAQRFIERAGLEPWPKLFHALRASRQTELLGRFPGVDVCRWLGNSPAVAAKHYAQPLPEVFASATAVLTVGPAAPDASDDCRTVAGRSVEPFRQAGAVPDVSDAKSRPILGWPSGSAGGSTRCKTGGSAGDSIPTMAGSIKSRQAVPQLPVAEGFMMAQESLLMALDTPHSVGGTGLEPVTSAV